VAIADFCCSEGKRATFAFSEKMKLKLTASGQIFGCSSGGLLNSHFTTLSFCASRWEALGDKTPGMFL
jgi:hypothetical protein